MRINARDYLGNYIGDETKRTKRRRGDPDHLAAGRTSLVSVSRISRETIGLACAHVLKHSDYYCNSHLIDSQKR